MDASTETSAARTAAPRRPLLGETRAEIVSTIAALALLGAALYLACRELDAWAAGAFAQPLMASALVAVCDLGLLLLALCLAPAVSAILLCPLRRVLGAGR